LNLPNALTLFRVLLIPVFILFLSSPATFDMPLSDGALVAAGVFFIASVTDWLDGYIARQTGQVTKVGKLFDPIADKLLVLSALILLVPYNKVPSWMAIVIIGREFAVTGLRAMATSEGHVIPAQEGGKAKMLFQIIAILALLLDLGRINFFMTVVNAYLVGTVALWIAMILAVLSGIQYFISFWDKLGLGEGA
jgi:CDP-diacylglycerol---glycerol-3-phosphate 3-phosphatidyltransferase